MGSKILNISPPNKCSTNISPRTHRGVVAVGVGDGGVSDGGVSDGDVGGGVLVVVVCIENVYAIRVARRGHHNLISKF